MEGNLTTVEIEGDETVGGRRPKIQENFFCTVNGGNKDVIYGVDLSILDPLSFTGIILA